MEVIQQMAAVAVVLLLLGATLWVLRRRGLRRCGAGQQSRGAANGMPGAAVARPAAHAAPGAGGRDRTAAGVLALRMLAGGEVSTPDSGGRAVRLLRILVLPRHRRFQPWARRANRSPSSEFGRKERSFAQRADADRHPADADDAAAGGGHVDHAVSAHCGGAALPAAGARDAIHAVQPGAARSRACFWRCWSCSR